MLLVNMVSGSMAGVEGGSEGREGYGDGDGDGDRDRDYDADGEIGKRLLGLRRQTRQITENMGFGLMQSVRDFVERGY